MVEFTIALVTILAQIFMHVLHYEFHGENALHRRLVHHVHSGPILPCHKIFWDAFLKGFGDDCSGLHGT